jgi:hypothetical protein
MFSMIAFLLLPISILAWLALGIVAAILVMALRG